MNSTKQFWTLLKFQPSINPLSILMPLILVTPDLVTDLMGSRGHDYYSSLDFLLPNRNLFFVGFIEVMWLAPEVFQLGYSNVMWSTGTEFLLTRAVDRRILIRARISFFYLLILIIPVLSLLGSLKQPTLQIAEYRKVSYRQILDHIPGSIAAPPDKYGRREKITIPNGNLLIGSWHLWMSLVTAIGIQVLIFLLYPFKYRRFIMWALYVGIIFFPFLNLENISSKTEKLSSDETLFFSFMGHQFLFWILVALALIFAQLWCERRFTRFEQ